MFYIFTSFKVVIIMYTLKYFVLSVTDQKQSYYQQKFTYLGTTIFTKFIFQSFGLNYYYYLL